MSLKPVKSAKKAIASTFWGQAWCRSLHRYSDYESRLPRGRSYLRSGAVIDLQVLPGRIEAMVVGSRLYDVIVRIDAIDEAVWKAMAASIHGQVASALDLLCGRLSDDAMALITAEDTGLFPDARLLRTSCTCPDSADLCKHAAAVLYGVAVRFDAEPELFFTLRGVDPQALIPMSAAAQLLGAEPSEGTMLTGVDLGDLFGIDLDEA